MNLLGSWSVAALIGQPLRQCTAKFCGTGIVANGDRFSSKSVPWCV